MKNVAMMMATTAPTPKETPTAWGSVSLILAEPPFQTMRRASRNEVRKTLEIC